MIEIHLRPPGTLAYTCHTGHPAHPSPLDIQRKRTNRLQAFVVCTLRSFYTTIRAPAHSPPALTGTTAEGMLTLICEKGFVTILRHPSQTGCSGRIRSIDIRYKSVEHLKA